MDSNLPEGELSKTNSAEKSNYFLGVSVIISGLVIALAVIYAVGRPPAANNGNNNNNGNAGGGNNQEVAANITVTADDVVLGEKNAPVSVVEYADFQCPFCAKFFTQVQPQLKSAYVDTGKVKFVYRDYAFLGPESFAAAEAARCANDQAKFWAYHDALYNAEIKDGHENNGNLTRDLFIKLAGENNLNLAQFTSCLDSKKYQSAVQGDVAKASAEGVGSTPTIFVNNTKILGAQPFYVFSAAIDAALVKK